MDTLHCSGAEEGGMDVDAALAKAVLIGDHLTRLMDGYRLFVTRSCWKSRPANSRTSVTE